MAFCDFDGVVMNRFSFIIKANQPTNAMKKLHVEAQKARMCGFSCTVPPNRSNGSSVDFNASLTAHLKVGVSAAVGVPGIVFRSMPSVIELDEVSIFQPAECFSRRRDC